MTFFTRNTTHHQAIGIFVLGCLAAACGTGAAASPSMAVSTATPVGYAIVPADGSPMTAVAGDAMRLMVVRTMSDGATAPISPTAKVSWAGPPAITASLGGGDANQSAWPSAAATATAMWLDAPEHFTSDQLRGVLWILDPGTRPDPKITVTATVSDGDTPTEATATIAVGPTPPGDAARGKAAYAANCAQCHGSTAQGSAKFPGLNNTPENLAGDPSWNAALMAITARSDVDNKGVSLDVAMPKWLVRPSSTGALLTTRDFADIYAWLKTQTP